MAEFDFSTLVTDRTLTDLETIRGLLETPMSDWTAGQLAEFNQAVSKGAYDYTDLNRVTACMDYLNDMLTGLGYETGYQRISVPHQDAGGRLPSGYTELQYIESTGTQWIDTDITPTQNYTLYIKVAFLGSSGTNVLGTRNSSNDTTNRFGIISFGASALFGAFYGTNSVTGKAVDQNLHEFSIGPDGFTMDEETVSVQQTNFSCSYPIILFGFNNGANGIVGAEEKVYSCKIYSDGQLVRDFIPCINPDGITGLYDKETAIFYQNSGSGDFLNGPELDTPIPVPELSQYTWYENDTPTETQMQQYIANITAIRGALTLPKGTVFVPNNMANLTQEDANAIEKILEIVEAYLTAMQKIFLRSGMAWAISGGPYYYLKN